MSRSREILRRQQEEWDGLKRRLIRTLDLASYGGFVWHIEAVRFAQMYLASGWTAAGDVDGLHVRDRRGRRPKRALGMCGTLEPRLNG